MPTGGAGNITGGLLASLLGFPVNLYCAQNDNSNVVTLINKGKVVFGGDVTETYSNAMDILGSYNVERILYFLSDSATASNIMNNLKSEGKCESAMAPSDLHVRIQKHIKGGMRVDDKTTLEVILQCWDDNNYLV